SQSSPPTQPDEARQGFPRSARSFGLRVPSHDLERNPMIAQVSLGANGIVVAKIEKASDRQRGHSGLLKRCAHVLVISRPSTSGDRDGAVLAHGAYKSQVEPSHRSIAVDGADEDLAGAVTDYFSNVFFESNRLRAPSAVRVEHITAVALIPPRIDGDD